MHSPHYDIVVIGAGVAGGVFAASQNKKLKILVVERDLSEKERIVGELMQPDGLRALAELNLQHLTKDIDAQTIEGYKLIKKDNSFTIKYAEIENGSNGLGLRNGKLLNNIRKDIQSQSHITLVEGNVVELIEDNNKVTGIKYTNSKGEHEVNAHLTVVSDGHSSLFRTKLSKPNKHVESYFMGLILKDLNLKEPAMGHMIVSGDSPILVYPIKSNEYRILIDYPGQKPPRMGTKSIEKFKDDVSKLLPSEMIPAFHSALTNQQIQVMPNHRMKAQAFRKKGVVLLGDSLNMRHPLTGGGMTASFNDVITLNSKIAGTDLSNDELLETAINEYYNQRTPKVETINILANALYKVFRDEDLKEACFEYLKKGGKQSTGPLSILAGLNKDKKFLLKHFFKVAMQKPASFITKPKKQIRLYKNALGIIKPLLKEEDRPAMI